MDFGKRRRETENVAAKPQTGLTIWRLHGLTAIWRMTGDFFSENVAWETVYFSEGMEEW